MLAAATAAAAVVAAPTVDTRILLSLFSPPIAPVSVSSTSLFQPSLFFNILFPSSCINHTLR
jgi:hypothetical protein